MLIIPRLQLILRFTYLTFFKIKPQPNKEIQPLLLYFCMKASNSTSILKMWLNACFLEMHSICFLPIIHSCNTNSTHGNNSMIKPFMLEFSCSLHLIIRFLEGLEVLEFIKNSQQWHEAGDWVFLFITGLSHGSCAVLTTQDTGCEHHYSKRKLLKLCSLLYSVQRWERTPTFLKTPPHPPQRSHKKTTPNCLCMNYISTPIA